MAGCVGQVFLFEERLRLASPTPDVLVLTGCIGALEHYVSSPLNNYKTGDKTGVILQSNGPSRLRPLVLFVL